VSRGAIVLVSVTLYLALCIGIGLWALRRTKSTEDFFMGGRSLGAVLIAFAVFSSTMSGFGFVGGPGLVYRMGMSSVWMVLTSAVGMVVVFSIVAKRVRLLGELRDCISLPDIAFARYKSNGVRGLMALVVLLGVLGYLATQILAMSVVLQEILRDANFFPNTSLGMAVLVSTAVLVFYTVTGGIIASIYTDLVQGIIMVVAALFVFGTVLNTFDGGMAEISQIIATDDADAMGPWGTLGIFGAMSWLLMFAIGGAGQPHVITKYMMLKDPRDLRKVIPMGAVAYVMAALLWIGLGLAMRALVLSGRHEALGAPDMAAAAFLQGFTDPYLAGIVFAALLAAVMSTADGFLNIGTAAIIHDLPNALVGRSIENELLWARITTVGLAAVAALIALYSGQLVALLGAFGWGTFSAAIVPVVGIGLNWKRATPRAAIIAIVASLAVNFGVRLSGAAAPYNVDPGAVSMIVSIFLFLVISLVDTPVEIDSDVEAVMEL
jgi:SSS family transporter